MENLPEITIIIVNYNTCRLLENCLESIYKNVTKQSIVFEIVVVDNGSTDGSVGMMKLKFPKVNILINNSNLGFGAANNMGLKKARGEYILFLNSDIIVLPGAIEKLLGFAKRHPKTFVGGKLFNVNGTPQTSCGPFFSIPTVFMALFLKGDRLGITRYSPNKTIYVDWVSGACLIAPKKLIESDLTFDESIFMYMDEVDLLYRAKSKGYRTMFFPNAKFIHIGAASSADFTKPVLNIYNGLLYFYKKHYSKTAFFILKIILRLKAVLAVFIGFIFGNVKLKKTYAQAHKLVH